MRQVMPPPMTTKDLDAIRRRTRDFKDRQVGLVVHHRQAVTDREDLLEYIAWLEAEIKAIGVEVTEALGASRILLGLKLVEDRHAPTLGAAMELVKDTDRVRALYPVAG